MVQFIIGEPKDSTIGLKDNKDISKWEDLMARTEDIPYEERIFFLTLEFLQDFPFKPPRIKFLT